LDPFSGAAEFMVVTVREGHPRGMLFSGVAEFMVVTVKEGTPERHGGGLCVPVVMYDAIRTVTEFMEVDYA
jgi:ribosomal protein L14